MSEPTTENEIQHPEKVKRTIDWPPALALGVCSLAIVGPLTAAGVSDGDRMVHPHTDRFDNSIEHVQSNITKERAALTDLKAAKPDTDDVIASTRALISNQQVEVKYLRAGKADFLRAHPGHRKGPLLHGAIGFGIGVGIVGALIGLSRSSRNENEALEAADAEED